MHNSRFGKKFQHFCVGSALAFHHLIPNSAYSRQVVTTLENQVYETTVGSFRFRKIKPELFFGYQVLHLDGLPVLMADREKAILDYLYFPTRKTNAFNFFTILPTSSSNVETIAA